jgi:hypothetical protein
VGGEDVGINEDLPDEELSKLIMTRYTGNTGNEPADKGTVSLNKGDEGRGEIDVIELEGPDAAPDSEKKDNDRPDPYYSTWCRWKAAPNTKHSSFHRPTDCSQFEAFRHSRLTLFQPSLLYHARRIPYTCTYIVSQPSPMHTCTYFQWPGLLLASREKPLQKQRD